MNFNYQKVVGKDNADQKTWMTPLANLFSKSYCPKNFGCQHINKINFNLSI
jgi:hypothetical protein